jgi:hypothetical protein
LADLIRMPCLVRHPAGGIGGEVQDRPSARAAGEDAEAGAEEAIQLLRIDAARRVGQALGVTDAIQREDAERGGLVAVGGEVAVVAIAQQALGMDSTVTEAVALAAKDRGLS